MRSNKLKFAFAAPAAALVTAFLTFQAQQQRETKVAEFKKTCDSGKAETACTLNRLIDNDEQDLIRIVELLKGETHDPK